MSLRRLWLFLVFSTLASQAFAVDYYWWINGLSGQQFASPKAACDARGNQLYPTNPKYVSSAVQLAANGASATCTPTLRNADNSTFTGSVYTTFRDGTGCTPPKVYNTTTGACEAPQADPCEAGAGGDVWHEHRVGNLDGTGGRTEPPAKLCENKCQAAFSGEAAADCYRYVATGDLNGAFCRYKYKLNGVSCTDGDPSTPSVFDQPPTKPPSEKDPTAFQEASCDTWVTNPDGTRTRNCTSVAENKEPGSMDCPAGMSPLVCTPTKPYPNYDKTEKTGTQTEKSNPDGSSEASTSTTTTTTKCRGTLPCTTVSKTETTADATNADGTPGDSSSTCTGKNCQAGSGEGDGGKDDQEQEGECDPVKNPKGCEEEEKESVVTGDECNATLACEGDAIQCAILRKEKEQACMWDYDKAKGTIEGEIAKSEYQLKEDDHDVSGLFSSAIGAARWLPATCPPPEHFALSSGNGVSGQFSWQPTCDFASGLGPVLVAGACLFFAVYVGRGIGGGA